MTQEVTKGDKEIVSAALALLAGRVGQDRCQAWFGRSVELRVAGNTLVVAAADPFRLDYVRRSFRTDLAASATELLGEGASTDFVLDGALAEAVASGSDQHSLKAAESAHPHVRNGGTGLRLHSTGERASSSQPPDDTSPQSPQRPHRRTFASLTDFVVGSGNQVAFVTAQAAVDNPGQYSPLTFVGPPGCGKTHLLEGIWRAARTGGRVRSVIYLTAEQFTNQFLEALKHTGTPNFRRKYRDVGLLLIDDVQFLAGKNSTVVELVHTIDTLLRDGRQIVFAADRPPAELRGLGQDLIARLAGGLVCPLAPADGATRLQILKRQATRHTESIPEEVLEWLAAQLDGDARHLTGALNRLTSSSRALSREITMDFAQGALADLIDVAHRPVRLPEIVSAVCEVLGVEADDLGSSSKSPSVTFPRMLIMFLARKHTRASLADIGRSVGRKSHSTVVSAQRQVGQWLTSGKRVPLGRMQATVEETVRRIESQLRVGT
jgi:chromosomal replication initiator protein